MIGRRVLAWLNRHKETDKRNKDRSALISQLCEEAKMSREQYDAVTERTLRYHNKPADEVTGK